MDYKTYSSFPHQTVPQISQTVQETEEEECATYTETRLHLHIHQEDPPGVLHDWATHVPSDRYDNYHDDAH